MSTEESRLMFLSWLRNTYPELYAQAMRMTVAALPVPRAAIAGYSDPFIAQHALGDFSDPFIAQQGLGAFSDWTSAFSDLLKNVGSVATQYLTTKAQVAQVQTNVSRVNRGLPPLNADGTVMTVAQMRDAGYTEESIAQIEATMARSGLLTGGVGGVPFWALGLGAAGLLFLVMRRR